MIIAHKMFATDMNTIVVQAERSGAEMEMDCRPSQYIQGIAAYKSGAMIQDAFGFLTATEREFLMTGMSAAEQERFYSAFEEDDEP